MSNADSSAEFMVETDALMKKGLRRCYHDCCNVLGVETDALMKKGLRRRAGTGCCPVALKQMP